MTPWIKNIEIRNGIPELSRPVNLCYEIQRNSEYFSRGRDRQTENHCIFHYCLQGHGCVRYKDRVYDVLPEHGFLCVINDPDMDYFYPETETEQWHFYWISYIGGQSRKLTQTMLDRHGPIFPLKKDSFQLQVFEELKYDTVPNMEMNPYDAAMLVDNLLLTLGRNYIQANQAQENALIQEAEKIIKNDPTILGVNELAEKLGVCREHLSRLYHKEKGKNLKDAINEYKCVFATSMLFNPDIQIKAIAKKLGFSTTSNFARMFKAKMNMSPKAYRIYQRKKLY